MAEPEFFLEHGVYEFVFGADRAQAEQLLAFWEVLGFTVTAEGRLDAGRAEALYGHEAELHSWRLAHPGCATHGTGLVRLQCWSRLRNYGLGNTRPITPGSRWMGLYTHDILQLRDSFAAERSRRNWNLWISPLVHAPLEKPAPEVDYYHPFVGLRETLVFGDDFRLAFIQRGGFDRPGFGTFDDSLPFKNTEGSHASLVQPANAFDTDFYKQAFGFETAPFGEAHESGEEAPTIAALDLRAHETFMVERLRAPEVPSGLLQVYSSHKEGRDRRDLSHAGCRNLGVYSVRSDRLPELAEHVNAAGAGAMSGLREDEFGHPAFSFYAPDGLHWLATDPAD